MALIAEVVRGQLWALVTWGQQLCDGARVTGSFKGGCEQLLVAATELARSVCVFGSGYMCVCACVCEIVCMCVYVHWGVRTWMVCVRAMTWVCIAALCVRYNL
jgi:hypothetical protein